VAVKDGFDALLDTPSKDADAPALRDGFDGRQVADRRDAHRGRQVADRRDAHRRRIDELADGEGNVLDEVIPHPLVGRWPARDAAG
jgi:hypothetical protein